MNILIAPNSMKGSLNAFDFADAIEDGFIKTSNSFHIKKIPVADGGDFTGEILRKALNANKITLIANDPLARPIQTSYAISNKTAIIEMADISGMKLLNNNDLNPMVTSSFGTGELIKDAIEKGCKTIMLGIGGSATVDGGSGMLEALGAQYFDSNNNQLKGNGGNLSKIKKIIFDPDFHEIEIKIISDVKNPLLGKNGAAHVFGPQKGADAEMVEELEKGLTNWINLLENYSKKPIRKLRGSGAAGGIATGLIAFLDANIVPGADFVLDTLEIDKAIQWADLVITGEGKIDGQTLNNKAPFAVAQRTKKFGKPIIAIGGAVETEASAAFDGIFSITNKAMSLDEAMKNARKLVIDLSEQIAKLIVKLNQNT